MLILGFKVFGFFLSFFPAFLLTVFLSFQRPFPRTEKRTKNVRVEHPHPKVKHFTTAAGVIWSGDSTGVGISGRGRNQMLSLDARDPCSSFRPSPCVCGQRPVNAAGFRGFEDVPSGIQAVITPPGTAMESCFCVGESIGMITYAWLRTCSSVWSAHLLATPDVEHLRVEPA